MNVRKKNSVDISLESPFGNKDRKFRKIVLNSMEKYNKAGFNRLKIMTMNNAVPIKK